MYLSSDRASTGIGKLFTTTRAVTSAAFGAPTQLFATDFTGEPAPAGDGLSLFFTSLYGGTFDVFVSTRATTSATFNAGTAVGGVNIVGIDDRPAWLSTDMCRLYLSSTRPGTTGGFDLWVASRP